jgi:hypothetical protein
MDDDDEEDTCFDELVGMVGSSVEDRCWGVDKGPSS